MEVSTRRARGSDAAALAELAAVTFPLACPPGSPATEIAAFIATHLGTSSFAAYLADPRRALFVARDVTSDGRERLLAYTMLVDVPTSDSDVAAVTDGDAVELSKCYAHPDVHGGAVTTEILHMSFDWVAGNGNRQIWLGVNSDNLRAQRFYAKHGFSIAGTRKFQLGKRVEHDFVMTRPQGITG